MTKLTTERLEELANATTPSVKYVGREIIAMARQLLAYEQAAPAQPALVENLKKVMNSWFAVEPKLAYQPEFTDVMMLLDAEAAPAQPVIPRKWTIFNAVSFIAEYKPTSYEEAALLAWNACRAEVLKAQPVSACGSDS